MKDKETVGELFKNSTIETVLIYKSSALITRSFEFTLQSKVNFLKKESPEATVQILEIPESVNFQNFSCKAYGNGKLLESSIQSYVKLLDEKVSKRLQEEIKELEKEYKELENEMKLNQLLISNVEIEIKKHTSISKGMTTVVPVDKTFEKDSDEDSSESEESEIEWKKTFSQETRMSKSTNSKNRS
jgi:hypothetical protein